MSTEFFNSSDLLNNEQLMSFSVFLLSDPPRPQSRAAVLESKQAGLTVRMLTGDHPATAEAISLSVGILDAQAPKGAVMTGMEFDALTEDEIDALTALPLVVARCGESRASFSFFRFHCLELTFLPFRYQLPRLRFEWSRLSTEGTSTEWFVSSRSARLLSDSSRFDLTFISFPSSRNVPLL